MIEREATIRNHAGIHCRPSSVIIRAAKDYRARIRVTAPLGTTNLRSILELMTLELIPGATVKIRVDGPNEKRVCDELVTLFETHFDFPDAHGVGG